MNSDFNVGLLAVYCMAFMGFKITDCIQLLCYALQYSTPKGTVNVSASVMITAVLHLVGDQKKKFFRLVMVA